MDRLPNWGEVVIARSLIGKPLSVAGALSNVLESRKNSTQETEL